MPGITPSIGYAPYFPLEVVPRGANDLYIRTTGTLTYVYDITTLTLSTTFNVAASFTDMLVSPDNTYVVAAGADIDIYDIASGYMLAANFPDATTSTTFGRMAFSPSGNMLAIGLTNAPFIMIIDMATLTALPTPPGAPNDDVNTVYFADNGDLVVGTSNAASTPRLFRWDTQGFSLNTATWVKSTLLNSPVSGGFFSSAKVNPGSTKILICYGNPSGNKYQLYDYPAMTTRGLAGASTSGQSNKCWWSADGNYVVASKATPNARAYDAVTDTQITTVPDWSNTQGGFDLLSRFFAYRINSATDTVEIRDIQAGFAVVGTIVIPSGTANQCTFARMGATGT